jgi:hypothetical protein
MKEKNMTTKIAASLMIATATLVVAPLAHATAELELISGASTVTVTTGVAGVYNYNGSVGSWNVNISTGTLLGNYMDLNSVDQTTAGTSTPLEILWSTSFAGPISGTFNAGVGGTLTSGMTVAFSSYYSSTLLGTTTQLTPTLTFTSTPYSGTTSGSISGTSTYVTEVAMLSGATAANSEASFDFDVSTNVPDGGTTLVLLGGAMAGMTFIRSKINKRK